MHSQSTPYLKRPNERARKRHKRIGILTGIVASIWAMTAMASTARAPVNGCVGTMKLIQATTQVFYDGSKGWDGAPQTVRVPSEARCAVVTVVGGGGYSESAARMGGYGDVVHAAIPVKGGSALRVILQVLVAGRAGVRGSGGLSGIFSGTPSARTALIVAGGGSAATGSAAGHNASLTPANHAPDHRTTAATAPDMSYLGGITGHAIAAVPYGIGGHIRYLGVSFHGGYGGGQMDWTGALRHAGSGDGGSGRSYCSATTVVCKDAPGKGLYSHGAPGKPGLQAQSGYVTITFYN